jgi:lycopene cyclase CruA
MLNTFFGLLATEPPEVADTFIKDRVDWLTFNRLALIAAWQNPSLLPWIWELAGPKDILRWLGSYFSFTLNAVYLWLLGGLVPRLHPAPTTLAGRPISGSVAVVADPELCFEC